MKSMFATSSRTITHLTTGTRASSPAPGPTEATNTLWGKLQELQRQERAKGGVLDIDVYVNTLNLIHYMHDKYFYEAAEMALIDTDVRRTFATGIAGFSHVIDSICAVKSAEAILREGVSFI